MPEVIGIDHIYLTVSDPVSSEAFYDQVMGVLGFRKSSFSLDDEAHVQYYNRYFGYVLRPAHSNNAHDPYAPGLHHLCLRVESEQDVADVYAALSGLGIKVSESKLYPEYAPDFVAVYFADPDGLRLEVTNYRQEGRYRHDHWDQIDG